MIVAMAKRTRTSQQEALEAAKSIMRGWARKGGKTRAKILTPEERQAIARKAARARWGKR
jgi:hypothetical protein